MYFDSAKFNELLATLHVFHDLSISALVALKEGDAPRLKYTISVLEQLTSTEVAHFEKLADKRYARLRSGVAVGVVCER